MPKIFISYRRADSQWPARSLHAALSPRVGNPKTDIFMDIDNIPLGVNFAEHVDSFVRQCDVLLALIGPGWLDARDAAGARRLDDPRDFVRTEIAVALKRGIPVVPVLLDNAQIPNASSLPDELKELALRNGVQIRHESFRGDAERLIRGLHLGSPSQLDEPKQAASVPAFNSELYAFISYPKDINPNLMRVIVRRLFALRVPVWLYDPSPFGFSEDELRGMRWQQAGGSWRGQTVDALTSAPCVLGLVGRATLHAEFQSHELALAAQKRAFVTAVVDDLAFADLPESVRERHSPRLDPSKLGSPVLETAISHVAKDVADHIERRPRWTVMQPQKRKELWFLRPPVILAVLGVVAVAIAYSFGLFDLVIRLVSNLQ